MPLSTHSLLVMAPLNAAPMEKKIMTCHYSALYKNVRKNDKMKTLGIQLM